MIAGDLRALTRQVLVWVLRDRTIPISTTKLHSKHLYETNKFECLASTKSSYEVRAGARFLRRSIYSILYQCRMQKVFTKMGYVFEKKHIVPHGNVIEQNKMLVDLPHIAHMRHHG